MRLRKSPEYRQTFIKTDVLQETADLVTFTEEILNGKLHCSAVINSLKVDVRADPSENGGQGGRLPSPKFSVNVPFFSNSS